MRLQLAIIIWGPFAASSLLTLLVYGTLWSEKWYWVCLSILGIICCVLAVRILIMTGLRAWPVVGIFFGLLIGQWWLVELIVVQILWYMGGFAP